MKNWKVNLAAAWVAQFICIAGFSASFPFLPFYIRELGVRGVGQVELWSGIIVSAGAVSMAIFSPIWGSLSDRYGRKLMVERATIGGAVSLIAMVFAGNVHQLLLLRLLQGMFTGTVPAFMTLVASFAPPSEAAFALGLMQTSVFIGASVGPMIGGFVADHYGYRAAFGVTAGMLVIAGLLVYFLVHEKFERPTKKTQGQGLMAGARMVWQTPAIFGAVVALGGVYMANVVFRPILPLFVETLQRDPSMVNTATGTVYGVTAASSAISAALIGRIAGRAGYRKAIIFCSIGATLAYAGQAISPGFTVLLLTSFLTGLFSGGILPTANAILARNTPDHQRGAIFGISTSINGVTQAVAPMIGAGLATAVSLRASIAAAAVLSALVTIWVVIMLRPHSPAPQSSALAQQRTGDAKQ